MLSLEPPGEASIVLTTPVFRLGNTGRVPHLTELIFSLLVTWDVNPGSLGFYPRKFYTFSVQSTLSVFKLPFSYWVLARKSQH